MSYPLNKYQELRSLPAAFKAMLLLLMFCCFQPGDLYADDPGIAKVRLIQQSDSSYVFEVDIPQNFLGSFQKPILPPGFTITKPEREFQSGWVTLKADIIATKRGFSHEDIIVLPWARNAVDVTAQWLDGTSYKGFFTRSLNGIHVPLNQIMSHELSTKEVLTTYFISGLRHWQFKLVHILLVFTLVIVLPNRKLFKVLLAFTLGQMTAMVLIDFQITGSELLFGDLMLLLLVIYIAFYHYRKKKIQYLLLMVFATAICHSMSLGNELRSESLLSTQKVQAVFAFNMAMDMGNYLLGSILLGIMSVIGNEKLNSIYLPVVSGSLAVFCMLYIFNDNVLAGNDQVLDFQTSRNEAMVQTTVNNPIEGTGGVSKSKGFMTSPIMLFLSVEPYETRKEILITGREVVNILDLKLTEENTIPSHQQPSIKRRLEQLIGQRDSTFINKDLSNAEIVVANFVILGKGGVTVKETAVDEDVDEAIVGITLNYLTGDYPDSIRFNWHLFSGSESIDLSMVDPHATYSGEVTPLKNEVRWASRIKGYKVPAIEPIEVKKEPIAIISYAIWFCLILAVLVTWFYKRVLYNNRMARFYLTFTLLLGFLLFPFARPALGISFISHGKPSMEKGKLLLDDLLTNVYRAFDQKLEDAVYDRLALSVTDEQLAEIYLQNRESMALENRGGARATVDEVTISEVYAISQLKAGTYQADTEWTVRGSVNHFGHTHYRQNRYRALVTLIIEKDIWKIGNVEILDARRIY
ncbi:hypothetical protein [Carboxylicivirga sp. RSCT41]|uniref:hypothetical protein n=1 Tax=Carboxylicivirga agarovorans TaxID=3417570 RepID=UPI003D334F40